MRTNGDLLKNMLTATQDTRSVCNGLNVSNVWNVLSGRSVLNESKEPSVRNAPIARIVVAVTEQPISRFIMQINQVLKEQS